MATRHKRSLFWLLVLVHPIPIPKIARTDEDAPVVPALALDIDSRISSLDLRPADLAARRTADWAAYEPVHLRHGPATKDQPLRLGGPDLAS